MTQHTIIGSGGGGGKGNSGSSGGTESQNTLRSAAIALLAEILGEGEMVGLVLPDGTPVDDSNIGQAIFFNDTPVQNVDNTFNFNGLVASQRFGLPDQDYLTGFNMVETPFDVSTQVKKDLGPVTRTVSDENVDCVRVIARLPALAFQNTTTGDLTGASVEYAFDVRVFGGDWVQVVSRSFLNQKCTSAYQVDDIIDLPQGGAPWDIRMRRLTNDSTTVDLQNDTVWDSYSEVIKGKFIYPDTAIVSLAIDSQQFGSSIPTRSYRVRGLKTNVPSNYDPIARTYTGIWDGTFVKAWHNNPAWVFYDLVENNRYGLGEFISAATIDKWGLYTIARYCDELVPSGFFDDDGDDIMEPRFVFNGVINNQAEAYTVLQDICVAFRGMAYWSLGQVFATADMPKDPVTTVAPANVIDGHFKYSGTGMKSRHSVALVSWNDPQDHYRPAIEVVQNDNMIYRFGWRQIEVAPTGCTSRGQALRFGKWILDTEQNETETVEFTMSFDGYVLEGGQTLKPGDIFLLSDPRKTGGVRTGGRLTAGAVSSVSLDLAFDPLPLSTYNITVILPDGTLETKNISAFSTDKKTLTLSGSFSTAPAPGAMFVIQGTDVQARRYRTLAVKETEDHLFAVTGLFQDPAKYERIEQNIALIPVVYSRPPTVILVPTNALATESRYFQNGVSHSRVNLSWTPPNGFMTMDYVVTADTPRGFVDLGSTGIPSIDISDPVAGLWSFHINARSRTGLLSDTLNYDFTVEGWQAVDGPVVDALEVQGGGNVFSGKAPTLVWTNVFPPDAVVYALSNTVRVYDVSDNLLRTEVVAQPTYTYDYEKNLADGGPRRALRIDVTCITVTGAETAIASISITNPVPAVITPTFRNAPGVLEVSYTPPTDYDFAGVQIWGSTSSGFAPGAGNLLYDGPDTKPSIVLSAGTYYLRIAGYDAFGKVGLNVGPQFSNVVSDIDTALVTLDQLHSQVPDRLAELQTDIDQLATSLNSQIATLEERGGRQIIGMGARYLDNSSSINQLAITTAAADAAQAILITGLDSRLTNDEGTISGNSSAITALTTRVTTAEGTIVSQGSSITSLSSSLTSLNGTVSGQAGLISGLDTRVTAAEGTIVSQGSSITSINSSLTGLNSTILGQATTINGLSSRVSQIAGIVEANAESLQSVSAQVDNVTAEGSLRIVADVAPGSALAAIKMEVRAGADGGPWADAALRMAAYSGVGGTYSEIRMDGDRIVMTDSADAPTPSFDGTYIKEATIGTLQLKPGAILHPRTVTFPSPGTITVSPGAGGLSAWTDLGSFTVDVDSVTDIVVSWAQCQAVAISAPGGGSSILYMRMVVDGALVGNAFPVFTGQLGVSFVTPMSIDIAPTVGSRVYKWQIAIQTNSAGSYSYSTSSGSCILFQPKNQL